MVDKRRRPQISEKEGVLTAPAAADLLKQGADAVVIKVEAEAAVLLVVVVRNKKALVVMPTFDKQRNVVIIMVVVLVQVLRCCREAGGANAR